LGNWPIKIKGDQVFRIEMSAPTQTTDIGTVPPQSEWQAILRQTAVEVFSTMVGVTVTVPEESDLPVSAHVTGMIGIAGPLSAIFSIRCSEHSAIMLASQMLGVSLAKAAEQKCDAVGEICNIVAGYFKAKIGLGDRCQLSVPTVVAGTDYQVHSSEKGTRLELPLLYGGEPLWLALDIRP
jgi:chemotaxis protein CheX